ncbi:VWFA domain-containing protein [Entamoeba marina]
MLLFLILTTSLATLCPSLTTLSVYNVEDAFECIDSVETTEEFNTNLVNSLKVLLETYVYKDIMKSPPQPNGYSSYYEIVNIDERLNDINVTETSMYTFYREIKDIFHDIHDLHLSFTLTSNSTNDYGFDSFYAVLPFSIEIENNGTEAYFIPNTAAKTYGFTIPETLTNNENVTIKTVNDKTPFEWIREFGDNYTGLKSPHGKFTYALETMATVSLAQIPLTKDILSTPITVVYENGDELTLSYEMFCIRLNSVSDSTKEAITKKITRKNLSPLTIGDLIEMPKLADETVYDYQSTDGTFACKTYDDDEKQINTITITSFHPADAYLQSYLNTLGQCFKQFDSNDYPISVILPMNGGGLVAISQYVEQFLAPHSDVRITNSERISSGTANCLDNLYDGSLHNISNCESVTDFSTTELYTNPNVDTFGEYEHKRTQPTTYNPVNILQLSFDKIRKPTEIVVFTDGFCYSACSLLTKDLKEKGNAIIVGFEGDPEGDLNLFDAGQSPTFVIGSASTNLAESDFITEIGGTLQISFVETYVTNYEYDETIPREFIIDPIDERIHIYKYDETKLDTFAESALEIIEKYKTSCNADNDKLHLIKEWSVSSDSVDHAYVGYLCDDGVWSTVQTPTYCDDGYFLDLNTRKCVENVCYEESSQFSESSSTSISESSSTPISESSSNFDDNDGCSSITIIFAMVLLFILL